MDVVIRIYASYDADLAWLCECGVSMATFAKNVLTSYTYGTDLHYVMPEIKKHSTENNKTLRTRFSVNDKNVIKVLKNIKPRKKNLFIKTLMRNALVRQNMAAFFCSQTEIDKENEINRGLISNGYSELPVRSRKLLNVPVVDTLDVQTKDIQKTEYLSEYKPSSPVNEMDDEMIPKFDPVEEAVDNSMVFSMFESLNEDY